MTDRSQARQVLGLIPARAGSKGVPGKNVRFLAGAPLIGYTLRTAAASAQLTRLLVSTDSEAIADVARQYGADVPFQRPAELAADESPMADVVRHALQWLREHERYEPAIVVLLQPTVPFRAVDLIDRAVAKLDESDADAVVTVSPVPTTYNPAWQFRLRDGLLERADGRPIGSLATRRQDLEATYSRDGAVYAFRAEAFWRTGSFYGDRTAALIVDTPTVNIDTLEDWSRAERFAEVLNRPPT